jgi:hypothetical protein
MLASLLLLRGSSKGLFYSSHLIDNKGPISHHPNNFWQMDSLDYLLYDAYNNHITPMITASESFSITNGYVRNLQLFQRPLLIHSIVIERKECLGATAVSVSEIKLPEKT